MDLAVLHIVAEGVAGKARSLAGKPASVAWGLKKDFLVLSEGAEMIRGMTRAFKYDGEVKGNMADERLESCLKTLEDADKLLDEFAYEVLRKKMMLKGKKDKVCNFFSSSNPLVFRFKVASKIKKINSRMGENFRTSYQFGIGSSNQMKSQTPLIARTDKYIYDYEVVGRDDDMEKIVSLLTCSNDEEDISVIGIVGMAGQGKTAVARQLFFNNKKVTEHFGMKIWTCVAGDLVVERVVADMLRSLKRSEVSEITDMQAIVSCLKEEVDGKRLLLILDDVWSEDPSILDLMNLCLGAIGGEGSRIIVTTRNVGVVSMMNGFVYHLGALSTEASQELFEKIAFADGEAIMTPELLQMGETIVNKCGGLPLAINAVGTMLCLRRDASEWSKIAKADSWGSFDGLTEVMSSVKLSYDHLSSPSLKQCFAYCAIFPKESIIERKPLIHQWIAHGFVYRRSQNELDMEVIGNKYFQILLQRSLFQSVEFDVFGNVESCKMHNLLHDVALEASRVRYLTVEGGLQIENIRPVHLSVIANGVESLDNPAKNFFGLRTLFLYSEIFSNDLLAKCKYLCVFVAHDSTIEQLPNSINKLKYLKYLDISGTCIRTLPNSITTLYNLQTLRLGVLLELPRDFGNLIKLRHLYVRTKYHALLPGISKLNSLRTVSYFVVSRNSGCQIDELGFLKNLEGSLPIYGLENVNNREEALKADLSSKTNVVNLEFHWRADIGEECNYGDVLEGLKPHENLKGLKIVKFAGESLPSWMMSTSHPLSLHNLVTITLKGLTRCRQIPPLGHLPFLKVVDIRGMESVTGIGDEFYGGALVSSVVAFPSLKQLSFENLPNLDQWSDPTVNPSHESDYKVFPVLEILKISGAQKLTRLPTFFNAISSLKELRIYECHNLSHVPEDIPSLENLELFFCSSLVSIPGIQSLQFLGKLTIWRCNNLADFPIELEACKKLKELEIDRCSSIRIEDLCFPTNLRKLRLSLPKDVDFEDFPWPRKCASFPSLESLYVKGTSKIKSLPEQIKDLPILRELIVEEFHGMDALPEWLCNIPSLQSLRVCHCRYLAHLPTREALQRLTASCELILLNCPILKERCEEGSGPEWDKTASISNICWLN